MALAPGARAAAAIAASALAPMSDGVRVGRSRRSAPTAAAAAAGTDPEGRRAAGSRRTRLAGDVLEGSPTVRTRAGC